ncbi:MAG: DNA repair protein RecO, partial [Acidobacteria bacterium]|nr:DNA repair protein RecO [Acidobacteriota bacterium]
MGEMHDDAIVLDALPYRDRHQIVTVLTAGHGLVRGVLRGARGGKNPLAAATQVLSRVRLTAWRSPNAELATYRAIELERPSFALAEKIARWAAATAVAELLVTFCPLDEPAPRHFRLADAVTRALLDDLDPAALVAYTELWTLALGGLLPELDVCSSCGAPLGAAFHLSSGDAHPLCDACAAPGSPAVDPAAATFLRRSLATPPAGIAT